MRASTAARVRVLSEARGGTCGCLRARAGRQGLHLRTYGRSVDGDEQGADASAVARRVASFGRCASHALRTLHTHTYCCYIS